MQTDATKMRAEKFIGLLQGIAVGDALGLPAEGLSPAEIRRRWRNKWTMRLIFGRGMISDDTEHALLTAECLAANATDAIEFQHRLAWKLRWWFIAVPPAIGLATARACLKLLCGWPISNAGVRSAGNGALIRALVIGAFFADDVAKRAEFTRASTRLTHSDERAEIAAIAVAEVAAIMENGTADVLPTLTAVNANKEWREICSRMACAARAGKSLAEFAKDLGLHNGITGYCFHTAPVAIYACMRDRNDFREIVESVLNCGGDTDSTAAIVGGLIGFSQGSKAVPKEWLERVLDWPNSVSRLKRVARALAGDAHQLRRRWYFVFAQLPRNMLLFTIVVFHGLYRFLRCVLLKAR